MSDEIQTMSDKIQKMKDEMQKMQEDKRRKIDEQMTTNSQKQRREAFLKQQKYAPPTFIPIKSGENGAEFAYINTKKTPKEETKGDDTWQK